jgi:tetratricopeptide (TPR) repeat protein
MLAHKLRACLVAAIAAAALTAPPARAYEQADKLLSGNYLAGRSASVARDNDLASDYFVQALKADPGNPVLIERVFLLKTADGDIANAEEFAVQVLGFNSQQRMARIVLGLRDFRNRHYADARKNFEVASYTPVGELTSGLLVAWSYAGDGDLNNALKALDRLDRNEAFANFKNFHAGLLSDYLGNAIRAEVFYKKAYDQAGTSLRVLQAYGNFLERNNRRDEAIRLYTAFLEGDDNPLIAAALANAKAGKKPVPMIGSPSAGAAEALFSLATSMTDDQSIDVALLYTQLALSMDSDRPVVLTLLGDVYGDMKLDEKAIDAYSLIPESSVLSTNAEMEIGVSLHRLDRTKEAQQKLLDVIAREPDNYDALVTLGNIYRSNEDYANAAKIYDKAIALVSGDSGTPGNWRIYYYNGIAHERLKQWDIAERHFRKALELSPDEPTVLNYLGYSLIEKKQNLPEAMDMVKKAVELRPNDGYIIDSLGWAYFQLGDYDQAVIHIERAVELLPADPIIAEHLGDAYWRVGRRLEAKFQWQHARDNKPEPADLARIEDKLKNGMPDEPAVTPAQNATDPNAG